jgi:hypothetical protein
MVRMRSRATILLLMAMAGLACGGDAITDPPGVVFGEPGFVVVVNPVINDANQLAVPLPGSARAGVTLSVAGGPSGVTDAGGVAVLVPVTAGSKLLTASGTGAGGQVTVSLGAEEFRELALSVTGSAVTMMANVDHDFEGEIVQVTPSTAISEVNAALARSDVIVFFRSGSYTGNLTFSGSRVTLFGEGPAGGSVVLNGNVVVSGSHNRIRGARITGDLSVPGSDFSLSFSRVDGTSLVSGSNSTLLNNGFCGTVTVSGSGTRLLGNAGLAPIPQPASC